MKRLLASLFLVSLISAASAQDLPKGKGGELLDIKCTACHTLSRVTSQSRDRDQWAESVKAMVDYGTDLTATDQKTIIDYLAKYFGEPLNVNKATAADLQKELDLTQQEAEAFVETRKAKGDFEQFSDIGKVPGLDLKKLEDLRDRILFH